MFASWQSFTDIDRTVAAFEALQRQARRQQTRATTTTPLRYTTTDTGEAWVVTAELPGVAKETIEVTLTGQVLTLSARRTPADVAGPDGDDVVIHRSERPSFTFKKSFTLPHKIDGDAVTATAKDGVFTVTLPKAKEAQARQIAVR